MKEGRAILLVLVRLYCSPFVIATNAGLFVGYWLVFYTLIRSANLGFFLVTLPLAYTLVFVASASFLATLTVVYLIRSVRRRKAMLGVAQSPAALVAGTVVLSCTCNLPLLAPLLYAVGLNALDVSSVLSFLAQYQLPVVMAIVLLNLASAYYYLRLIARSPSQIVMP